MPSRPFTRLLTLVALLSAPMAHAGTLYVSPGENLAGAIAVLRPGDTLYLKGGQYGPIDDTQMTIPSGTSWDAPVTIASAPGETAQLPRVFIRNQVIAYVSFERLLLDGGGSPSRRDQCCKALQFDFQSHLRIKDSEIRNANDQLITAGQGGDIQLIGNYIHGAYPFYDPTPWPQCGNQGCITGAYCAYFNAHDSLIENNRIEDCSSWGFHLYWGGGSGLDNNVIRGNVFRNISYDDGQRGSKGADLILSKGEHNQVYNNIFTGSTSPLHEVAITTKNSGDQIYNNTIYGNAGIGIYLYPGSSGTVVRNNIVWQTTGPPILDQGSGATYCPSDKPGCNVTQQDPKFVAPGSDFHLQTGSVAIQAGTPMPGLRYSGAYPDAGAIENGAIAGGKPVRPAPKNLRLVTAP
jgi:parallel beta-helix repeat protein